MNTIPAGTEEIDVATCWGLLRQSVIGRLAVIVNGRPDIFPVNFVVDHGSVVIRTAEGAKLTGALHAPVAFEVDGYDASDAQAWSVVIKGSVEQIRDKDEVIHAMALPLFPCQGGSKPRFLRVVPDETTGRRIQVTHGFTTADPPV